MTTGDIPEVMIDTEEQRELTPRDSFLEFDVNLAESDLLSKSKEELENLRKPWSPDRRAYGALPNFENRDEIIGNFPKESGYFKKHYNPRDTNKPAWMNKFYAEGIVLFEMKFGRTLSSFCEEILANYPDLHKSGKEISIFGLSGSGKSTVVEVLKKKFGDGVIIMDSDTVRFNLLARMIKDVEMSAGVDLEEIRDQLINNDIVRSLYMALNYLSKELKQRGYLVVESSTQPVPGADKIIYVEHPDNVDPVAMLGNEEKQKEVAHRLFERTQSRIGGLDNYDWSQAETITDFRNMIDVSVRVPERIHEAFLKNVGQSLNSLGDSVTRLPNPQVSDVEERERLLTEELEKILN